MKEQIRRVLDMVARERLSDEDAGQLLAALSGKLMLKPESWRQLFALTRSEDFSVEEVAALLEAKAGVRRASARVEMDGFPEGLNINEIIQNAMQGRLHGPRGPMRHGGPGRAGSVLRVNVEDSDGNEMRANIPLSLAEHAPKLLPPRVLEVLARQGITPEALVMLLSANPQPGELLNIEGSDGTEIRLEVE